MGRASSQGDRDCQGNNAARACQGQSEPGRKPEHTWDQGTASQSLTAELVLINITGMAPLSVFTHRAWSSPPRGYTEPAKRGWERIPYSLWASISSYREASPSSLDTPPKNSNDKEFGGLCKTLHSAPGFRTSLVAPHSIFLESSNSTPSISSAPSREVARSLRSPKGEQTPGPRCPSSEVRRRTHAGAAPLGGPCSQRPLPGSGPLRSHICILPPCGDDALDLINSLFVCIISLRKDY